MPLLGRGAGHWSPSNKVALAEAYLHTEWHLNLSSDLATTDIGRKLGWGSAPLGEGSWVPIKRNVARPKAYLRAKFHLDPSNRLATVH